MVSLTNSRPMQVAEIFNVDAVGLNCILSIEAGELEVVNDRSPLYNERWSSYGATNRSGVAAGRAAWNAGTK